MLDDKNSNYKNVIQLDAIDSSRNFMASVFLWMFAALGISAGLAYWFAHDMSLLGYLIDFEAGQTSILGKVAMFAPIGFVLLMSYGFHKLSYGALVALFIIYAALTGISLSFILLIYTTTSIYSCFFTASALFGVMAVAGYTTKQDLTKFGAILTMLLVGLVIATVINWFMNSEQLQYIISFVGVAIFVGLTAYDVQKLKNISQGTSDYGEVELNKLSILGALTLYLDFINLFLFILRLFGRRK